MPSHRKPDMPLPDQPTGSGTDIAGDALGGVGRSTTAAGANGPAAAGIDLHIRQLSKRYANVAALDAVDLDVASGELVALLGPSGSGKTTLLRVIAGLLHPDSGRVLFGADDATRLSLRERNVGFVFQHYALFKHMTVAENIAFGLRSRPRRRRPDKATIARRVDELLALIQLPGFGNRYPEQLSGGQKQRVALARALAIDPNVLLLDEPFGALDAKVRVELRRWLRRLHDQTGQTTLFVTHDQDEALELADRVVVLKDGRIEQVGTPDEIYNAPASAYVFDFIGRANRLEGRIEDGHFQAEGQASRLRAGLAGNMPAQLYVRPHDIALVAADAGLRAEVVAVHRRADRITLELSAQTQSRLLELDLPTSSDTPLPAIGSAVGLQLQRYRVYPG
ncbi:sulfate transport system ATP-binding protein [Luteimonas cucumeris]|uniref:Sulfate transport system ATP-binding protein n=1 Tax=Luteimonas cucumeris TaxID=985012 RepID=A0A562L2P8_9GAMM|nr:sulfate transport system ATP-binding protein [Luteimonas cucumeris]